MSSRKSRHVFSLRTHLIAGSTLSSGILALVVGVLILSVSWRYLMTRTYERIDRMALDLQSEYLELKGLTPAFIRCMKQDAEEHNAAKTFILLTNPRGEDIQSTRIPARIRARILRNISQGHRDHRFYTERDHPDDRHIAVRFRTRELNDGRLIVVARDITDVERYLIFLLATLIASFILITVCSGLFAALTSTRLVRRMRTVAQTAQAIENGDWSQRVDTRNLHIREIFDMVQAFNGMCDKNERTLSELRVLTDNIAHDLRTPLTRLAMAAETEATGGTLREPLPELVSGETTAMLEMINTMLEISQTDARIDHSPRMNVDLTALLRGLVDFYEPLAEQAGQSIEAVLPSAPCPFSGHRAKLQQLAGNLIENALKYTPCGGQVKVSLQPKKDVIGLIVSDTGCGISSTDLPHVFTRFWRADSSRSLPGNGLGLALAKAIVTSYGGRISCTSEPGKGSVFTVQLPTG